MLRVARRVGKLMDECGNAMVRGRVGEGDSARLSGECDGARLSGGRGEDDRARTSGGR